MSPRRRQASAAAEPVVTDAGMTLPHPNPGYVAADLWPLCVPVETLAFATNNARRHDIDKDVPVLMESLRRFGQRKPIVGKRLYRGVENAILAGNGTLLSAQRLRWTFIAVSWLPADMDDETAQDYALMDNRTAELSEWDLQALAEQLRAVQARGGDAAVTGLGWRAHEAAPLLRAEWHPSVEGHLPGREVAWRSTSCSLGQWLVIELAVQRMQQQAHDPAMTEGRALELIAADFLGGPPPEET